MKTKKPTVSSAEIQRKCKEFERFYGCERGKGKRRKPVVPRLMKHFGLSRATIMRALAGEPRSGRKRVEVPKVTEKKDFSAHLASGFQAAQNPALPPTLLGLSPIAGRTLVLGPEHGGKLKTVIPKTTESDTKELDAMREVLIESIEAFLSSSPTGRCKSLAIELLTELGKQ